MTMMIAIVRAAYDTAANWTSINPILKLGEAGVESDTDKHKWGDGVTPWNSLPYGAAGSVAWSDIASKPTTLSGYGITDGQPLDGDLTALAALTGTSTIYYRSAANTWTAVTVAAGLGFSGGTLGSALGTAATQNTGTSGSVIPLLSGANIWSGTQQYGVASAGGATTQLVVDGGGGTNGGPYFRFNKNATTIGYIGAQSAVSGGTSNALLVFAVNALVLHSTAGTISFVGSATPSTDNTRDLGSVSLRWLSGYISAHYAGIRTIAATASVATSDYTILCDATAGALSVNLPAASGQTGRVLHIKKIDASANAVTLDGSGAETIDGAATQAIAAQWAVLRVQCNGTSWFIL